MRRNDVASTSFRRRVPIRFLINQCQIITFLILKYDIIENSRIGLIGIVLPVQMGGLLGGGGGGAKGMLPPPPLKLWGGGCPPPPLAPLFLRLCNRHITSAYVEVCDHVYSFPCLISRIYCRRSVTMQSLIATLVQLRAHWLWLFWSLGLKNLINVPSPVGV